MNHLGLISVRQAVHFRTAFTEERSVRLSPSTSSFFDGSPAEEFRGVLLDEAAVWAVDVRLFVAAPTVWGITILVD